MARAANYPVIGKRFILLFMLRERFNLVKALGYFKIHANSSFEICRSTTEIFAFPVLKFAAALSAIFRDYNALFIVHYS